MALLPLELPDDQAVLEDSIEQLSTFLLDAYGEFFVPPLSITVLDQIIVRRLMEQPEGVNREKLYAFWKRNLAPAAADTPVDFNTFVSRLRRKLNTPTCEVIIEGMSPLKISAASREILTRLTEPSQQKLKVLKTIMQDYPRDRKALNYPKTFCRGLSN